MNLQTLKNQLIKIAALSLIASCSGIEADLRSKSSLTATDAIPSNVQRIGSSELTSNINVYLRSKLTNNAAEPQYSLRAIQLLSDMAKIKELLPANITTSFSASGKFCDPAVELAPCILEDLDNIIANVGGLSTDTTIRPALGTLPPSTPFEAIAEYIPFLKNLNLNVLSLTEVENSFWSELSSESSFPNSSGKDANYLIGLIDDSNTADTDSTETKTQIDTLFPDFVFFGFDNSKNFDANFCQSPALSNLQEIADLTGGKLFSLCEQEYSAAMTEIAQEIIASTKISIQLEDKVNIVKAIQIGDGFIETHEFDSASKIIKLKYIDIFNDDGSAKSETFDIVFE